MGVQVGEAPRRTLIMRTLPMEPTPPSTEAPPLATPPTTTAGRTPFGLAGTIASWVLMLAAGVVALGLFAITVGPRFLPYQALIVRSGWMAPTIPTGSIV